MIPSLMLLLHAILQDKTGNTSDAKPISNAEDVSTLRNQKWVIRRRNRRGQLRHKKTLDHEPSYAELEQFGPGNYSILTTKPQLKACKSVVIKDKGVSAPTKRPLKPAHMEKAPERFPSCVGKTDPKIPLTTRYGDLDDKRPRRTSIPEKREEAHIEPQVKQEKEFGDLIEALQRRPVAKPKELDEDIRRQPTYSIPKVEDTRPKKMCQRCLEPSTTLVPCDHCGQLLCRGILSNCYEEHECSNSKLCFKCGRRVPNEIAEIADLCHRYFCSPKCMNECKRGNWRELGCVRCNGGSNDKKEEEEVDEKMVEGDGYENESPEEDRPDDQDVEETCRGRPKRIACRKCQKENCQGRDCDGYCRRCHFNSCAIRCECGGECKFCPEFSNCEIRCKEAPNRCDKRRCRGFACEDRWVSGAECDQKCRDCVEEGCYFLRHPDDEDSDNEA